MNTTATTHGWTYQDHNVVVRWLSYENDFKSKDDCISLLASYSDMLQTAKDMYIKVINAWFDEDLHHSRKYFIFDDNNNNDNVSETSSEESCDETRVFSDFIDSLRDDTKFLEKYVDGSDLSKDEAENDDREPKSFYIDMEGRLRFKF